MAKTKDSSIEYYRVGVTTDGKTTLTILMPDQISATLTMNQEACEQLIRMLQSTFLANIGEIKND